MSSLTDNALTERPRIGPWLQWPRVIAVYLAVFLMMPLFMYVGLATEILIFGVFVLSFNLLFGFSGLLSFGHALFLGTAGYLTGLLIIHFGLPIIAIFLVVFLFALGLSLVVGLLSLRLTGLYFAMITFAFSQLFYEAALEFDDLTGGTDGLTGVYRPSLFGLDVITFQNPFAFHLLAVAYAVLAVTFTYLLARSTFGRTLQGIRQNEERIRALGVDIYRVKTVAFVVSGLVASGAGVLWALYIRFVGVDILFWTVSGDAVIQTLVGGMNSLSGPLAGAFFVIFAENQLFENQPGLWSVTLGTTFVFFVLFARSGVVGLLERGAQYALGRWVGSPDTTDAEATGSGD